MKLISWNVNGFRACLNKGFNDYFTAADADFFCLQETKMQPEQANFTPEGYHIYYHSAQRKGYSGTAVFCKQQPLELTHGINGLHLDEGRVMTLEYPDFFLVNCYVPNSQDGLARIDYRMKFEDDMRNYLSELSQSKAVLYCGDLNVAHQEIDLKNPQSNHNSAGFSDQERDKFSRLLQAGFVDSFRHLHPDEAGAYSWWSYRMRARERNAGWRIDYFIVSQNAACAIRRAEICSDIYGSDHCPVLLEIAL